MYCLTQNSNCQHERTKSTFFYTHPCEIDGSWCDMDIHQVVDYATLYVSFVLVYHYFFTCSQIKCSFYIMLFNLLKPNNIIFIYSDYLREKKKKTIHISYVLDSLGFKMSI